MSRDAAVNAIALITLRNDLVFWRWLLRSPTRIKRTMGTVVVTVRSIVPATRSTDCRVAPAWILNSAVA